eukprot:6213744-Pleurochrysis_carterae.AAC.5
METQLKWKSKITGVKAAGLGIIACDTRVGFGSGPNLTCTTLYRMLNVIAQTRGLCTRLNVLFDNSCGDNKNLKVVAFMAWLELNDGHTFKILDQSFSIVISQLMCESIDTMSALPAFMFQFSRPYNIHDVLELHCLWDWKPFLDQHFHRMSGFCTSQFGSGMHKIYCRKDSSGDVLRRATHASASYSALSAGLGISRALENPVVNPITGPGCSAAEVQREKRAH